MKNIKSNLLSLDITLFFKMAENHQPSIAIKYPLYLDLVEGRKTTSIDCVSLTKEGNNHTHNNNSNTTTYNLFWGLNCHIWNNDGDTVHLIHYDGYIYKNVK